MAEFKKANDYYQKSDYENAIVTYEGLVKKGATSAEVYYNLGNCYFKTGNVAKTILNYERARKLAPDDEDIDFNIRIAQLKVIDRMDAVPEIFYKRWMKAAASLFSSDTWSKILIVNAWILFVFLALYITGRSSGLKKFSFVMTFIMIILGVFSFIFSHQSYTMTELDQKAIVMSPSVYVKSSPDEKGTDQFIIHEGTRIDVLDEIGEWKKIRIANGSVGWLKMEAIEVI